MSGNETSAIGSLRAVHSGETNFYANCGAGNYADSLANLYLAPANSDGFISADLQLDPSVKSGYTIALTKGTATTPAKVCTAATTAETFAVTADPVTAGSSGVRYFHINSSGAIYWDTATIAPVQQGAPLSGAILQ